MRKVLIVAYYYPPAGEMGVFRTLKFTKYLPQFGFRPYVLTVKNRAVGSVDPTLSSEVPPEVTLIETLSAEHPVLRAPRLVGIDPRWFLLPDMHVGWLPFAVRRGAEVIRREGIDVILATAPVFSGLLVGHLLKKKTGRRLVVDFRDPWTQSVFTTYPSAVHRRIERRMERTVVEAADFIITTTEAMRRALVERYPLIDARSATIPNGFDADDFQGLARTAPADRFTIVYAGRFYGPRRAEQFLSAVRNVLSANPHLRRKLRVVFAGPAGEATQQLARDMHLTDVIEVVGYLPHRDSLQLMVNADVLLLIMAQEEAMGNGAGTMMIPGKTFEYLGARRPILAVVPEGAVAQMVRDTGSGLVVTPGSPSAVEEALLQLYRRWEAGTLSVTAAPDATTFERKSLAARLAAILESCSGSMAADRA